MTSRWRIIGVAEMVAAFAAFWVGQRLPSGGFTLFAIGVAAAGIFTFLLAAEPCRPGP